MERADIGPRTWAETAYAAEKRVAWIQRVYSPILHKAENRRITMKISEDDDGIRNTFVNLFQPIKAC